MIDLEKIKHRLDINDMRKRYDFICEEAFDDIEALVAENERLRADLKKAKDDFWQLISE